MNMEDKINYPVWPGWETVRLIGRGSYGAVYEIERELLGEMEKAALKVISIPRSSSDIDELVGEGYDVESITSAFKEHLKSIVAEYSLMRKMNGCANVVNCDDVRYIQHEDGIGWDIFIKMELLTPLTKEFRNDIDDKRIIRIGTDLCNALIACKKHSIIHRDIKPANIFVSANGDYKLGDFGIAKTVEKTSGGTKIGTYEYMAPEVYHNQPYGSAADIYSLGMVLYWLLNERRTPFLSLPPEMPTAAEKEYARKRRLAGEELPAPVHGNSEFRRIVLKACAYDVKDRYQSADELLSDLEMLSGVRTAAVSVPLVNTDPVSEDPGENTVGIKDRSEQVIPSEKPSEESDDETVGVRRYRLEEKENGESEEGSRTAGIWENQSSGADNSDADDEATVGISPKKERVADTDANDEETVSLRSILEKTEGLEVSEKNKGTDTSVNIAKNADSEESDRTEDVKNIKQNHEFPTKDEAVATDWSEKNHVPEDCEEKTISIRSVSDKTAESIVDSHAKRKKKKKIFKTVSISVAVIAVLLIAAEYVVVPLIREKEKAKENAAMAEQYAEAKALLDGKRYEEAISAFEALNGYGDSEAQIEACRIALYNIDYDAAADLMNYGMYEEAISAFEALNGYSDSKEMIEACWTAMKNSEYDAAVKLMNGGKYEEAISAFEALNGYRDSTKQIKACQTSIKDNNYAAAVALMNSGKYEEAISAFDALEGYKDSKELSDKLQLIIAISAAEIGDTITFGIYEQDNDTENGKEAIEWRVLDESKGMLLVVSEYALDCKKFNDKSGSIPWASCGLRTWLNGSFYSNVFSNLEKKLIAQQYVSEDPNPVYGTSGSISYDRVFLLSINEADRYFSNSKSLICAPTAYAVEQGVDTNRSHTNCSWWLRTPGLYLHSAAAVYNVGGICYGGKNIAEDGFGVRPAMWINLTP